MLLNFLACWNYSGANSIGMLYVYLKKMHVINSYTLGKNLKVGWATSLQITLKLFMKNKMIDYWCNCASDSSNERVLRQEGSTSCGIRQPAMGFQVAGQMTRRENNQSNISEPKAPKHQHNTQSSNCRRFFSTSKDNKCWPCGSCDLSYLGGFMCR